MKRIFLFGAGADAEQVYLKIRSYGDLYNDKILGILDNDSEKCGKYLHEYKVFPVDVLNDVDYDGIVICSSTFQLEIKKQLCDDFLVPYQKIIFWRKYLSQTNINFQYQRFVNENIAKNMNNDTSSAIDTSKTVVYTAIEGNYDNLRAPAFIDDGLSYVCFTDNKNLKSDVWDIRYVTTPKDKNYALDIRKFKTCPQDYFFDCTVTIWVDASFTIKNDLREYVKKYSKNSPILLFPHPERKCIYQECGELISILKEDPVRLISQAADYIENGYPKDYGLYAGGMIVRDMHNEKLRLCMRDWWNEVSTRSLRDQQSLPYVLWKNNIRPDICDLDINDNFYLHNNAHKMGHWRQELDL